LGWGWGSGWGWGWGSGCGWGWGSGSGSGSGWEAVAAAGEGCLIHRAAVWVHACAWHGLCHIGLQGRVGRSPRRNDAPQYGRVAWVVKRNARSGAA